MRAIATGDGAAPLQQSLMTTSLTGEQWLVCLGPALVMPVVVEVDKAVRRAGLRRTAPIRHA